MQHAKSIKFPKQNQLQKCQEGSWNWERREKEKVEEAQQKKSRQRNGERCTGDCEEWAESATFLLLCVGGGKTYGRIHNMPIHRTNYAEKEIGNPLLHTATAPLPCTPSCFTHACPGVQLCGLLKDCLHYLRLLLLRSLPPLPIPLPLLLTLFMPRPRHRPHNERAKNIFWAVNKVKPHSLFR